METTTRPPGKRPEKDKPAVKSPGETGAREAKSVTGKDSDKPSEEEVISHWRNPVTNQDEQEKITNAGGDDVPIANK